ncbi:hypothetical protein HGRIS_012252 [Hohenbuehelia grisea]|uniref:Uncharacterized protein n=1 Tax=Hohenbuehelia grisea TaxID=104357 RepID=A0ABR3IRS7_9AGAR
MDKVDASIPPATPASDAGEWIAVEPSVRDNRDASPRLRNSSPGDNPPTFESARFDTIIRYQRRNSLNGNNVKLSSVPSRFLNLSNEFEFAGWGSQTHVTLSKHDHEAGSNKITTLRSETILGHFMASGIAGNAILGSVFYALPSVVAVSGVYSPISLFIATVLLFLWRPIMEELVSALPIKGAPYTYILNVSTKALALVSATLLLLDFAATSVVSAATAASYLAGEVSIPFKSFVVTILVLVLFTLISLTGIKESARLASSVLAFHVLTMVVLIIISCIHWGRVGRGQLKQNWVEGQVHPTSSLLHSVYNGVCLGMLGLTGFETTPAYSSRIKPGRFPLVLRNLHWPAILFNTLLMLLVLALLPLQTVIQGSNILSLLAERAGGPWLRIWIVVDAMIVLCGGVLTGILSACELFEQLANDRILPELFLRTLPITRSPYISVFSFIAFSLALYASAGASLPILSKMFSLTYLTTMTLFPLSLLLLKFNRGRLPRESFTSFGVVIVTLAVCATIFAGNIAVDPSTIGYFAPYFLGVLALFWATQNKIRLLRWVFWIYDQYSCLHSWRFTSGWGKRIIEVMRRLKRQPVCILVKSDEINGLVRMVLYVQKNEQTSSVKMVHFAEDEAGIPSELQANAKIIDEAFPEITIDLVIVREAFNPMTVAALAHHLTIPTSLMFMSCPGARLTYTVAEFGTRIITL